MDPKISAGLGYLIPLVGLIFFFIEKQNRFVRFHTLQSVLLAVSGFVLFFVLLFVGIALAFVNSNLVGLILGLGYVVIPIGLFVGWLIAIINAFQGKIFKLPLIGDLAERWSSSGITAIETPPAQARGVLGGASTLPPSLSWRGKAALVSLRSDFRADALRHEGYPCFGAAPALHSRVG